MIDNWALFFGMLLLMVANGLLATLLTIRGAVLGRGFLVFLGVMCLLVSAVALTRKAQEAAPEETGHLQAMAMIGAPQSGFLQAEALVAEEEQSELDALAEESSR